MAPGVVAKQPEAADIGVEIVAHQPGKFRRPFLPAVAVIRLHVAGDHQPLLVEGEPRAQVHRARETTLDHVGGLVLVGIDAGQQLRRDVVELQAARRVRRKAVAAIELGPDERKTADKHLRRFARGVGESSADCRRLTETPGMRWIAPAADWSGNAPMSVAVIKSTNVGAFFLIVCAVSSARRTPTITISSFLAGAVLASSGLALMTAASEPAGPQAHWPPGKGRTGHAKPGNYQKRRARAQPTAIPQSQVVHQCPLSCRTRKGRPVMKRLSCRSRL